MDEEMFMLDETFSLRSPLFETEQSKIYIIYLCHVTFKENIALVEPTHATEDLPSAEFTILLSHDKLSHPSPEIFGLSCVLCCYYQNVEISCVYRFLQSFHEIYKPSQDENADQNKILRQFVNCFTKTHALHESEKS